MKVIGLTGGIGMGKSTAAQILRDRGIPVIDTDELAREVVQPGSPALVEIFHTFGAHLREAAGQLNRAALADLIFSNDRERAKLETILHPRITALWKTQLTAWQAQGRDLAVVVIPLLFETRAEVEFDAIVCLACTEPTQHQRLSARGWSPAQIVQRCAAQMPIAEKVLRSQYVVWTEGLLAVCAQQLARIIPD